MTELLVLLTSTLHLIMRILHYYLLSYVREGAWWPKQGPNKGREEVTGEQEREIRSRLLILHLKEDKL